MIQTIAYYFIVGVIAIILLRVFSAIFSRFKQRSQSITSDNVIVQAVNTSGVPSEQANISDEISDESLKTPHQITNAAQTPTALIVSNEFYAEAYAEIHNGKNYDQGLWARAYSESEGNEEKSKALYIKLRSLELETRKQKILRDITRGN